MSSSPLALSQWVAIKAMNGMLYQLPKVLTAPVEQPGEIVVREVPLSY
jgi:hypothetical protein